MKTLARGVRVLVAAVVLAPAAACVASPAPEATPWHEPSWFVEQAREREEARAAMQGCMDGLGWTLTMNEYGGTSTPFSDDATRERFSADAQRCRAENGLDREFALTASEASALYDRQLETRECLRQEGVDLPDPPTRETFVENAPRFAAGDETATWWEPYADLYDLEERDLVDAATSTAAQGACPQYWVR